VAAPILEAILPRAMSSKTTVSDDHISLFGDLAFVSGHSISKRATIDLTDLIVFTLSLKGSKNHLTALRALRQLASATSYVVDPVLDYPFLPAMLSILETEFSYEARAAAVSTLGMLGAVNPYHVEARMFSWHKIPLTSFLLIIVFQASFSFRQSQALAQTTKEREPEFLVVDCLVTILKDSSFHRQHASAVEAIMHILRSPAYDYRKFLPMVGTYIIDIVKHTF
jgi:FKBP12-rapamycin complex-associated protein